MKSKVKRKKKVMKTIMHQNGRGIYMKTQFSEMCIMIIIILLVI